MEEQDKEMIESHPETRVALILQEGMKRKNISLQKLSDQTGIALKHLENMVSGNSDKWPAAPYMRSYLIAIGEVLGFEGQKLWDAIREDDLTVTAGSTDRLPRNRYVFLQLNRTYIAIGGILLLILLFLLARLPSILGTPQLSVAFPNEELVTIGASPVILQGTLTDGTQITVNGQTIPLEEDGSWSTEVVLESGLNTFEIVGSKFLGRETKLIRQIIFEPVAVSTSTIPVIEIEPLEAETTSSLIEETSTELQ